MKTICIQCPLGCPIEITSVGEKIIVSGHTCKRGESYGISEYTCPVRSVTSLVKIEGGGIASVKTSKPVPKAKMSDVIQIVAKLRAKPDCKSGDILVESIFGTDSDIVITGRAD